MPHPVVHVIWQLCFVVIILTDKALVMITAYGTHLWYKICATCCKIFIGCHSSY